jgi:hypothetical protein
LASRHIYQLIQLRLSIMSNITNIDKLTSLLEKVQETIPEATTEQLTDILDTIGSTPEAILTAKTGKFQGFLKLVQDAQPGQMASVESATPIVSATVPTPAFAPIVHVEAPIASDSAPFDWDNASDEACEAEELRLQNLAARKARKARALALEVTIAETDSQIADSEAKATELNGLVLDASQELAKQKTMLNLKSIANPRITQMAIDAATEATTAQLERTEAAIGRGKSIALATPVAAEIAADRAHLRSIKMLNEQYGLTSATPMLLSGTESAQTMVTIDHA